MASKIDGVGPSAPPLNLPPAPAVRPGDSSSSPVAAPPPADRARLTGEAASLSALQQEIAATPSMDLAKVNALRAALNAGTYRVDPQAIAERLTQLERELRL